MAERLLIVVVLFALGAAAYCAFRCLHVRRAARSAATDPLLRDLKPGIPAVLYFTTPLCVPCRTQQQPALARLQAELGEAVQIVRVDAAEDPEAAARWGVFTAPTTFILDRRGQPRAVNHGVTETAQLRHQIEAAAS
jgi:thiol-disulfide isomerase/thioredoxin